MEDRRARNSSELTMDEWNIIEAIRKAKAARNADVLVTYQDGKKIKLWITEKWR